MSLVDQIIVQAASKGLSQAAAAGLAGTLSSSIGNLASQGMLAGLKFSNPDMQSMVDKYNQQYQQQNPAPTVDDITVTAGKGAAGGAPSAAQIAGGASAAALRGGAGQDAIADSGGGQDNQGTTVAGVQVTGAPQQPAALANIGGLAAPGMAANLGPELEEVVVTPRQEVLQDPVQPDDSFMSTEDMLAAGGLGAGLLALANSGKGAAGANGQDGGLDLKDLAGLGLLGVGVAGAGGGGGSGAKDALKGLADNNAALANRLGGIASAGFAGDIGGRGLNSLNRMVKKAQAAIRQRYSSMGMSGSTAEMQDLNAAAEAGVDLQFKIGQDMARTGLNAIAALTGQSASIYTSLLNAQTAKDSALGNALANFAGALAN